MNWSWKAWSPDGIRRNASVLSPGRCMRYIRFNSLSDATNYSSRCYLQAYVVSVRLSCVGRYSSLPLCVRLCRCTCTLCTLSVYVLVYLLLTILVVKFEHSTQHCRHLITLFSSVYLLRWCCLFVRCATWNCLWEKSRLLFFVVFFFLGTLTRYS